MADVKISALPTATTPLAGTEVLPIVQSATTKQVSIANITAGRAMSASSLTLTTPLSVANGGTNASSAGITAFNNITGYTASGATGTTSTNLVFSTSPTLTTPTFTTSFTSPLHIGGTAASSSLTLQSTSGVGTSDSIVFKVGNNGATTAATIDTSGNLLVGTTSGLDSGGGISFKSPTNNYISSYRTTSTSGNYIHAFYSNVGGTQTAKYSINADGTAGSLSDENFKKNVEPARKYLSDLLNISLIKFNWLTDSDDTPKKLGFSAQQVETIFPGMVDSLINKDAEGNIINTQKLLKHEVFIPMLVSAIQELAAKVTALEAANG